MLREQLTAYEKELRQLKNQEVTIRRLKERVQEVELQQEAIVSRAVDEENSRCRRETREALTALECKVAAAHEDAEAARARAAQLEQEKTEANDRARVTHEAHEAHLRRLQSQKSTLESRVSELTQKLSVTDTGHGAVASEVSSLSKRLAATRDLLETERETHANQKAAWEATLAAMKAETKKVVLRRDRGCQVTVNAESSRALDAATERVELLVQETECLRSELAVRLASS